MNKATTDKHKTLLVINIAKQRLELYEGVSGNSTQLTLQRSFSISTPKNGIGSLESTGCTPLGKHVIAEKIGADMPINAVFIGRVPTGEIYDATLCQLHPERDWILSRILWLQGLEDGVNKGKNELGCCDTFQRYIYIHGTPDSEPMGVPLSHGCVRMCNEDIIWLFEKVDVGTSVSIVAE